MHTHTHMHTHVYKYVKTHQCMYFLLHFQMRHTRHFLSLVCVSSPLSGPEEASRAAAQVASVSVGAAVNAGVATCAALIHVLAAAGTLLVIEARRTHTLEAAQRVVTGGGAADRSSLTLVLIWKEKKSVSCVREQLEMGREIPDSEGLRQADSPTHWFHW